MYSLSPVALNVLQQLAHGPLWQGNVVGSGCVELVQAGLVVRRNGTAALTSEGWQALARISGGSAH